MKSNDSGTILLFVIIVLPLLLIVAAVVVDIPQVLIARNQLQHATDSAALSAAGGLTKYRSDGSTDWMEDLSELFNSSTYSLAVNRVLGTSAGINFSSGHEFLQFNSDGTLSAAPDNAHTSAIRISRTMSIPTLLSRFVGVPSINVTTSSTAMMTAPRCFPISVPIAMLDCQANGGNNNCLPGQCGSSISVNFLGPSTTDNAAIYTPITSPPSAAECRRMVIGTDPGRVLCVGDQVNLNNGVMASCIMEMEDECALRNCSVNNPWATFVPLLSCANYVDNNNNFVNTAPITGIAYVGITRVVATGRMSERTIDMTILCNHAVSGSPVGGQLCGLYSAPRLIQ